MLDAQIERRHRFSLTCSDYDICLKCVRTPGLYSILKPAYAAQHFSKLLRICKTNQVFKHAVETVQTFPHLLTKYFLITELLDKQFWIDILLHKNKLREATQTNLLFETYLNSTHGKFFAIKITHHINFVIMADKYKYRK